MDEQRRKQRQAYDKARQGRPSRKWYCSKRWQRIRWHQLSTEPLCRMCKALNRLTPANVCDHIEPHHEDEWSFWHGPTQSLCQTCHSSTKQMLEAQQSRYTPVGGDGWSSPRTNTPR